MPNAAEIAGGHTAGGVDGGERRTGISQDSTPRISWSCTGAWMGGRVAGGTRGEGNPPAGVANVCTNVQYYVRYVYIVYIYSYIF